MSKHGSVSVTRSSKGRTRYEIEIRHDELNKLQIVQGEDEAVVWEKALTRMKQWDELWEAQKRALDQRSGKYHQAIRKRQGDAFAEDRTREAELLWEAVARLYEDVRKQRQVVSWQHLKQTSDYPAPRPKKKTPPPEPAYPVVPEEPRRDTGAFSPRLELLDRLSARRRGLRWKEAGERFAKAYEDWQTARQSVWAEYDIRLKAHQQVLRQIEADHRKALDKWEQARAQYLNERDRRNAEVDEKHTAYTLGKPSAILEYCDLVLSASAFPAFIPHEYTLNFEAGEGRLTVDYLLPARADLPTLKSVKYLASRKTFSEQHLSQHEAHRRYDAVVYALALRIVHDLIAADTIDALREVVVKGYVAAADPTAEEDRTLVLRLAVSKEAYLNATRKLSSVRSLFRKLGGVVAGRPYQAAALPTEAEGAA